MPPRIRWTPPKPLQQSPLALTVEPPVTRHVSCRRRNLSSQPGTPSQEQNGDLKGTPKDSSEQSRPSKARASASNAPPNLNRLLSLSASRAFSVPEPHLFKHVAMGPRKTRIDSRKYDEVPAATWYADRAAPPLLLTFDAFATLYNPKDSVAKQYSTVAERYGYQISEADIKASFPPAFKAMCSEFPNYGKDTSLSVEDWWKTLITHTLSAHLPNPDEALDPEFLSALYDRFASSEGYMVYPDVAPFLQAIGASFSASAWPPKRTMLGVISNSDPRVRSVLSSFGIPITPSLYPPRFAPVNSKDAPDYPPASLSFSTLSYDVGIEKPDPRIFDTALRFAQGALAQHDPVARLTRTGKDLLTSVRSDFWHCHVGDSLDKDVLPALAAGWDAVLLDRAAPERTASRAVPGRADPVTVVNSLAALRDVLTRERAVAALARGADVRATRVADGAPHALDWDDWLDEQPTVGFNAASLRTRRSAAALGPSQEAVDRARARHRVEKEARTLLRRLGDGGGGSNEEDDLEPTGNAVADQPQ